MEMTSKTGAKSVIWPEIIARSTPKSCWNTDMKSRHIWFFQFHSTQTDYCNGFVLRYAVKILDPVVRCVPLLLNNQTHTHTHTLTGAIGTDGYYVFTGVFYLSLSFLITVFIIIM